MRISPLSLIFLTVPEYGIANATLGDCALAGCAKHNAIATAIVALRSRESTGVRTTVSWRTRAATDADAKQPCALIINSSPFRRDGMTPCMRWRRPFLGAVFVPSRCNIEAFIQVIDCGKEW